MLTDFLTRLTLFFGRLDDVTWRDNPVRLRPRHLFAVRVATAMVPAFCGRRATARIILARERPGTVLGAQLDHRNSGDAAGERHDQQAGNDLPDTACRKTVETPGREQKIAFCRRTHPLRRLVRLCWKSNISRAPACVNSGSATEPTDRIVNRLPGQTIGPNRSYRKESIRLRGA